MRKVGLLVVWLPGARAEAMFQHVSSDSIASKLLELAVSIQPQGAQVWTVKQEQKPRVFSDTSVSSLHLGSSRVWVAWACGDILVRLLSWE